MGCLGVAGCYLVTGAILGKLIPVSPLVRRGLTVRNRTQRVLLALFGLSLAVPIVYESWKKAFLGFDTTLTTPSIQEEVKKPEKPNLSGAQGSLPQAGQRADEVAVIRKVGWGPEPAASLTTFAAGPPQEVPCQKVESFGLEQYNVRKLKYERFRGEVFVYAGDVRALFGGTDVYVIIGKAPLPDDGQVSESDIEKASSFIARKGSIKRRGDSIDFEHLGRKYRLTVTRIYTAVFGADKLAVSICEVS